MKIEHLKDNNGEIIRGPLLFNPEIFKDKRGFFFETWNEKIFNNNFETKINFVQDMHSNSKRGVLRGMHYQLHNPQGKLVRVTSGTIFDVVVDLRSKSKSFKKWSSVELSDKNKKILWIPEGFAHGLLVLSSSADVMYKVTEFWNKDNERSLNWSDKIINISWPLNKLEDHELVISLKDKAAPYFDEIEELGDFY